MIELAHILQDARGTQPRLALVAVKALQDEQEWLLVRAVRMARDEGLNWAQIGRLLGVSRQSARERFERLAPRVGPTPPHTRGRSRWEAHSIEVLENSADSRRRREFESGDVVFW